MTELVPIRVQISKDLDSIDWYDKKTRKLVKHTIELHKSQDSKF